MSNLTELKSLKVITDLDEIEISDLYEKDENNIFFLEYIIKHNIIIKDKKINIYLSNNYDILKYMILNNYYLTKYYDSKTLLDNSDNQSLLELIYIQNP